MGKFFGENLKTNDTVEPLLNVDDVENLGEIKKIGEGMGAEDLSKGGLTIGQGVIIGVSALVMLVIVIFLLRMFLRCKQPNIKSDWTKTTEESPKEDLPLPEEEKRKTELQSQLDKQLKALNLISAELREIDTQGYTNDLRVCAAIYLDLLKRDQEASNANDELKKLQSSIGSSLSGVNNEEEVEKLGTFNNTATEKANLLAGKISEINNQWVACDAKCEWVKMQHRSISAISDRMEENLSAINETLKDPLSELTSQVQLNIAAARTLLNDIRKTVTKQCDVTPNEESAQSIKFDLDEISAPMTHFERRLEIYSQCLKEHRTFQNDVNEKIEAAKERLKQEAIVKQKAEEERLKKDAAAKQPPKEDPQPSKKEEAAKQAPKEEPQLPKKEAAAKQAPKEEPQLPKKEAAAKQPPKEDPQPSKKEEAAKQAPKEEPQLPKKEEAAKQPPKEEAAAKQPSKKEAAAKQAPKEEPQLPKKEEAAKQAPKEEPQLPKKEEAAKQPPKEDPQPSKKEAAAKQAPKEDLQQKRKTELQLQLNNQITVLDLISAKLREIDTKSYTDDLRACALIYFNIFTLNQEISTITSELVKLQNSINQLLKNVDSEDKIDNLNQLNSEFGKQVNLLVSKISETNADLLRFDEQFGSVKAQYGSISAISDEMEENLSSINETLKDPLSEQTSPAKSSILNAKNLLNDTRKTITKQCDVTPNKEGAQPTKFDFEEAQKQISVFKTQSNKYSQDLETFRTLQSNVNEETEAAKERLKQEAIVKQKAEEERLKQEAAAKQSAEKERLEREAAEKENAEKEMAKTQLNNSLAKANEQCKVIDEREAEYDKNFQTLNELHSSVLQSLKEFNSIKSEYATLHKEISDQLNSKTSTSEVNGEKIKQLNSASIKIQDVLQKLTECNAKLQNDLKSLRSTNASVVEMHNAISKLLEELGLVLTTEIDPVITEQKIELSNDASAELENISRTFGDICTKNTKRVRTFDVINQSVEQANGITPQSEDCITEIKALQKAVQEKLVLLDNKTSKEEILKELGDLIDSAKNCKVNELKAQAISLHKTVQQLREKASCVADIEFELKKINYKKFKDQLKFIDQKSKLRNKKGELENRLKNIDEVSSLANEKEKLENRLQEIDQVKEDEPTLVEEKEKLENKLKEIVLELTLYYKKWELEDELQKIDESPSADDEKAESEARERRELLKRELNGVRADIDNKIGAVLGVKDKLRLFYTKRLLENQLISLKKSLEGKEAKNEDVNNNVIARLRHSMKECEQNLEVDRGKIKEFCDAGIELNTSIAKHKEILLADKKRLESEIEQIDQDLNNAAADNVLMIWDAKNIEKALDSITLKVNSFFPIKNKSADNSILVEFDASSFAQLKSSYSECVNAIAKFSGSVANVLDKYKDNKDRDIAEKLRELTKITKEFDNIKPNGGFIVPITNDGNELAQNIKINDIIDQKQVAQNIVDELTRVKKWWAEVVRLLQSENVNKMMTSYDKKKKLRMITQRVKNMLILSEDELAYLPVEESEIRKFLGVENSGYMDDKVSNILNALAIKDPKAEALKQVDSLMVFTKLEVPKRLAQLVTEKIEKPFDTSSLRVIESQIELARTIYNMSDDERDALTDDDIKKLTDDSIKKLENASLKKMQLEPIVSEETIQKLRSNSVINTEIAKNKTGSLASLLRNLYNAREYIINKKLNLFKAIISNIVNIKTKLFDQAFDEGAEAARVLRQGIEVNFGSYPLALNVRAEALRKGYHLQQILAGYKGNNEGLQKYLNYLERFDNAKEKFSKLKEMWEKYLSFMNTHLYMHTASSSGSTEDELLRVLTFEAQACEHFYGSADGLFGSHTDRFALKIEVPPLAEEEKRERIAKDLAQAQLSWHIAFIDNAERFFSAIQGARDSYQDISQKASSLKRDYENIFERIERLRELEKDLCELRAALEFDGVTSEAEWDTAIKSVVSQYNSKCEEFFNILESLEETKSIRDGDEEKKVVPEFSLEKFRDAVKDVIGSAKNMGMADGSYGWAEEAALFLDNDANGMAEVQKFFDNELYLKDLVGEEQGLAALFEFSGADKQLIEFEENEELEKAKIFFEAEENVSAILKRDEHFAFSDENKKLSEEEKITLVKIRTAIKQAKGIYSFKVKLEEDKVKAIERLKDLPDEEKIQQIKSIGPNLEKLNLRLATLEKLDRLVRLKLAKSNFIELNMNLKQENQSLLEWRRKKEYDKTIADISPLTNSYAGFKRWRESFVKNDVPKFHVVSEDQIKQEWQIAFNEIKQLLVLGKSISFLQDELRDISGEPFSALQEKINKFKTQTDEWLSENEDISKLLKEYVSKIADDESTLKSFADNIKDRHRLLVEKISNANDETKETSLKALLQAIEVEKKKFENIQNEMQVFQAQINGMKLTNGGKREVIGGIEVEEEDYEKKKRREYFSENQDVLASLAKSLEAQKSAMQSLTNLVTESWSKLNKIKSEDYNKIFSTDNQRICRQQAEYQQRIDKIAEKADFLKSRIEAIKVSDANVVAEKADFLKSRFGAIKVNDAKVVSVELLSQNRTELLSLTDGLEKENNAIANDIKLFSTLTSNPIHKSALDNSKQILEQNLSKLNLGEILKNGRAEIERLNRDIESHDIDGLNKLMNAAGWNDANVQKFAKIVSTEPRLDEYQKTFEKYKNYFAKFDASSGDTLKTMVGNLDRQKNKLYSGWTETADLAEKPNLLCQYVNGYQTFLARVSKVSSAIELEQAMDFVSKAETELKEIRPYAEGDLGFNLLAFDSFNKDKTACSDKLKSLLDTLAEFEKTVPKPCSASISSKIRAWREDITKIQKLVQLDYDKLKSNLRDKFSKANKLLVDNLKPKVFTMPSSPDSLKNTFFNELKKQLTQWDITSINNAMNDIEDSEPIAVEREAIMKRMNAAVQKLGTLVSSGNANFEELFWSRIEVMKINEELYTNFGNYRRPGYRNCEKVFDCGKEVRLCIFDRDCKENFDNKKSGLEAVLAKLNSYLLLFGCVAETDESRQLKEKVEALRRRCFNLRGKFSSYATNYEFYKAQGQDVDKVLTDKIDNNSVNVETINNISSKIQSDYNIMKNDLSRHEEKLKVGATMLKDFETRLEKHYKTIDDIVANYVKALESAQTDDAVEFAKSSFIQALEAKKSENEQEALTKIFKEDIVPAFCCYAIVKDTTGSELCNLEEEIKFSTFKEDRIKPFASTVYTLFGIIKTPFYMDTYKAPINGPRWQFASTIGNLVGDSDLPKKYDDLLQARQDLGRSYSRILEMLNKHQLTQKLNVGAAKPDYWFSMPTSKRYTASNLVEFLNSNVQCGDQRSFHVAGYDECKNVLANALAAKQNQNIVDEKLRKIGVEWDTGCSNIKKLFYVIKGLNQDLEEKIKRINNSQKDNVTQFSTAAEDISFLGRCQSYIKREGDLNFYIRCLNQVCANYSANGGKDTTLNKMAQDIIEQSTTALEKLKSLTEQFRQLTNQPLANQQTNQL